MSQIKNVTESELLEYCQDVIDEKYNRCQKHKWACQRFLNDLEDERYNFDWSRVEKVLRWSNYFKHTKGVLRGEHIVMHITQVFVLANIYGFTYAETGLRRFQKFYFSEARKNAKSQFMTVLVTYELMVFTGGELSEVYCTATKKDQAKIVYNEVVKILERCDKLKGKWREAYRQIEHLKTGSFCKPLSKEDGKLGDGLNPQFGCVDEYHAHPTSETLDILDSGMGARLEPLLGIITTAGFELNHPCYTIEYKLVTKILDPYNETDIEHYFCDVHELETNTTSEDIELEDGSIIAPGDLIDDPFDEDNWEKANPIVCSYEQGVKNLRKKAKEAQEAPDKLRNYLTKHMNVWVNQRDSGYMPLAKWSACIDHLPDLTGVPCYVGLDLSARNDLTSAALEFALGENRYAVIGKSFMPENRFHAHMRTDMVPYDLWVQNGWLQLTHGEVVDYKAVTQWAIETVESLGAYLQEFCVDPWGSIQISNDLINKGYEVVNITQGIKTLSEPTKDFRNCVSQKNIIHEGSPIISWAIGNAVVDIVDRNNNILLNKKKSVERIDPIVSIINAHVRAMQAEGQLSYNNREMRGF